MIFSSYKRIQPILFCTHNDAPAINREILSRVKKKKDKKNIKNTNIKKNTNTNIKNT
jgi:hypothetical protein